jgi:predicted MarR family transcription regulator
MTTTTYRLGQLRYDLAKLRAKGLVLKVPKTQTYRVTARGMRICVLFLKLSSRVYAPLAAANLEPIAHDDQLPASRRAQLDTLYAAVDHALDLLLDHLGFKIAA